jgi:hypothetical protein
MLKGLFASSWLRVCVGVFAALAIVLATAAPASAAERGPSHAHTTAWRGGGHGGGRGFHGGPVRHWGGGGPHYPRHFRGPRHVPFRRY